MRKMLSTRGAHCDRVSKFIVFAFVFSRRFQRCYAGQAKNSPNGAAAETVRPAPLPVLKAATGAAQSEARPNHISTMKLNDQDLQKAVAVTLEHYNRHAEEFWQGTRDHDVIQNIDSLPARD